MKSVNEPNRSRKTGNSKNNAIDIFYLLDKTSFATVFCERFPKIKNVVGFFIWNSLSITSERGATSERMSTTRMKAMCGR